MGNNKLRLGPKYNDEKVLYSDVVYRIIPKRHHHSILIQPAKLIITSHAIYDLNITQDPLSNNATNPVVPERRIPHSAIKQIIVHKDVPLFIFKLHHISMSHAIQYYNTHAELISHLTIRAHVVLVKEGLKIKFNDFDLNASILQYHQTNNKSSKFNPKKKGVIGGLNQVDAVAAFRGGMASQGNKNCAYCKLSTAGSSTRRHGPYMYHVECDPRERNLAKKKRLEEEEECLKKGMKRVSSRMNGWNDQAITGTLSVRREEERLLLTHAKEERKKEILNQINNIEDEEKKLEKERTIEINRRVNGQQLKIQQYETLKKKMWKALTCGGCKEPFLGGDYYQILNELWHPNCFKCYECGHAFDQYGYFIKKIKKEKQNKEEQKDGMEEKEKSANGNKSGNANNQSTIIETIKHAMFGNRTWDNKLITSISSKSSTPSSPPSSSSPSPPSLDGDESTSTEHQYRPFCRDHCCSTWWEKKLMNYGDISLNLRKKFLYGIKLKHSVWESEWEAGKKKPAVATVVKDTASDMEQGSTIVGKTKSHAKRKRWSMMVRTNREWFYLDEQHQTPCGPYKASEIVGWRRTGHLSKQVRVLKMGEKEYTPFMKRVGELYTAVRHEKMINSVGGQSKMGNLTDMTNEGTGVGNPMQRNESKSGGAEGGEGDERGGVASTRSRAGTRHKRHKTAEGRVFYEDMDQPGVTSWELPEGGILVGGGRGSKKHRKKGRSKSRERTGSSASSATDEDKEEKEEKEEKDDKHEEEDTEQEVPLKPGRARAGSRHRKIETIDGTVYYEDIDSHITAWVLPEGGVVVAPTSNLLSKEEVEHAVQMTRFILYHTAEGTDYYENAETHETSWALPEGGTVVVNGDGNQVCA